MPEDTKTPNSFEIDKALHQFEIESDKMPQSTEASSTNFNSDLPKMVQLIMKYSGGAIKDQRTAEYVLLVFAALAIGVSLYLFFGGGNPSSPSPEQLEQMRSIVPVN